MWHEDAPSGLAHVRKADGANAKAKNRAPKMKLRAFMTGSLEYNQL